MTQPLPENPWIHIGECPFCVNGLCRVRCCEDARGRQHLYALCDECQAMWLTPTTDSQKRFPDAEMPLCPICERPLFGSQAHWARSEDLQGTDWEDLAIFDVVSMGADYDSEARPLGIPATVVSPENFVTVDDIADALDAPPLVAPAEAASSPAEPVVTVDDSATQEVDAAYGQDEPKPGC